jgi:hypothetical protein
MDFNGLFNDGKPVIRIKNKTKDKKVPK